MKLRVIDISQLEEMISTLQGEVLPKNSSPDHARQGFINGLRRAINLCSSLEGHINEAFEAGRLYGQWDESDEGISNFNLEEYKKHNGYDEKI